MPFISQSKFDECMEISYQQGLTDGRLEKITSSLDDMNTKMDKLHSITKQQEEEIKRKQEIKQRYKEIVLDETDVEYLFKCEIHERYETLKLDGLKRWQINNLPGGVFLTQLGIGINDQSEFIDILRNSKLKLFFTNTDVYKYIIFPDLEQKILPVGYLHWYDIVQTAKNKLDEVAKETADNEMKKIIQSHYSKDEK